VGADNGSPRSLPADSLEVAVLDRNRAQRKFRRIVGPALTSLLPSPDAARDSAPVAGETEQQAGRPVTPEGSSEPPNDGGSVEPSS